MPGVYDDQKSDADKDTSSFDDIIGHSYKPGEADQTEARVRDEHAQGVDKELSDIASGERSGTGSGGEEENSGSASKAELAEQESTKGGKHRAPEESTTENSSDDSTPKKRGIRGWSKRKKWGAGIATALTGGGVTGSVLLMTLSPFSRIEMLISKTDSFFGAANNSAIDTGVQNTLNQYITKKVFPNLGKGNCRTTIDAACSATASNASNPIGRMFNTWKENRMEQKLAVNYGLEFGKRGNTYFLRNDHKTIDLKDGHSIFDSADGKAATQSEIRAAIRDKFKKASLYDKLYTKFKVNRFVASKYGVKHCITEIGCHIRDKRDKISNAISDKKVAFKAYFVRRVVEPYSQNLAIALQCVLSGGCNFEPSPSNDVKTDDATERRSDFSTQIQEAVDKLAAQYGADTLKDLAKQVEVIGKDGLAKYAFRAVLSKVLGKEVTSESLDKVTTPLGWVNLAAQIITFINDIGPKVQKMTWTINTVIAVSTYSYYATAAHEARSGHTDLTEFGSISDSLTTDTVDDKGKSTDMTQTPMYQQVVNNNSGAVSTTAAAPSLFDTTVYAAEAKHYYPCNDGNPVPAGQRECPEMVMNGGNAAASALSDAAKSIPGWSELNAIASAWESTIGALSNALSGIVSSLINKLPFIQDIENTIAGWVTPLMEWAASKVFSNPLASLTAGRLADLVMAGADVTYNLSAGAQLGAAHVTDAQAAQIRTTYLNDQMQQFQKRSLYARLFDTNSPDSLITHMAAGMPTRNTAMSSMASILRNPFGHFSSAVLGVLAPNRVFADVPAQPDAWGVPQMAIMPGQIPSEVDENWWDKNCPSDYAQKWLDSQTEDDTTGVMIASKPEPCMLYKTVSQVGGGIYDSSMLPSSGGAQ